MSRVMAKKVNVVPAHQLKPGDIGWTINYGAEIPVLIPVKVKRVVALVEFPHGETWEVSEFCMVDIPFSEAWKKAEKFNDELGGRK